VNWQRRHHRKPANLCWERETEGRQVKIIDQARMLPALVDETVERQPTGSSRNRKPLGNIAQSLGHLAVW